MLSRIRLDLNTVTTLGNASILLFAALAAGAPVLAQTIFSSGFESGNILEWDPPTVYRFSDFDLRDPHLFASLGILGCLDITDEGVVPGVNELVEAAITTDSEPDGFLDLNLLLQFRPLCPYLGERHPSSPGSRLLSFRRASRFRSSQSVSFSGA